MWTARCFQSSVPLWKSAGTSVTSGYRLKRRKSGDGLNHRAVESRPAATFDGELRRHKSSQKALEETSEFSEVVFCRYYWSVKRHFHICIRTAKAPPICPVKPLSYNAIFYRFNPFRARWHCVSFFSYLHVLPVTRYTRPV